MRGRYVEGALHVGEVRLHRVDGRSLDEVRWRLVRVVVLFREREPVRRHTRRSILTLQVGRRDHRHLGVLHRRLVLLRDRCLKLHLLHLLLLLNRLHVAHRVP